MIKNPKANLLILSAAPCCAVSSCQPPDTELLPGCLGAPGDCSLQSVAVPSWGGSGLAELCVVLPGRGGVLWSTNGSGLCHLAPRQGSARSERSGAAPPKQQHSLVQKPGGWRNPAPTRGGSKGYLAVPVVLAVPTFRLSEVSSLFWGENTFCCLLASAMS